MKKILSGKLAIAAAIIITLAGCAAEKPKTSIPGAELYSPEKIASMYISSLQMNQLENISLYFSKAVDPEIANKSAKSVADSIQIGQFKSKQISGDDNSASVQVVYNYVEKSADLSASRKKKYSTVNMMMLKEDGVWKIRTTGLADADNEIEQRIFLQCLNTVLDVTIAQEQLRGGRDEYTSRLTELQKKINFDESACGELSVAHADESSFQIVAKTKNLKPCDITANTDSHTPESYQECYE